MVWCTFSSCPLVSKFKHMQVRWRGNVKLNVFVSERCKYLDYTGSEAAKKTDKLTFNRGDDWIKLHVFHPHLLVTALTQESPESPAIRSSFWTEQGDDWFTKKEKKTWISSSIVASAIKLWFRLLWKMSREITQLPLAQANTATRSW